MINWTVTLTYEGWPTANELDDFEDALVTFDALVSSVPGLGFQAILHVDSADMIGATMVARDYAEPFAPGKLIELRAMTSERHVAQADKPNLPELVSVAEIADILGGVSRQRVHQLRSNLAFPKPLAELRTGAVWDARSITKFAAQWDRKPGRRAKIGHAS